MPQRRRRGRKSPVEISFAPSGAYMCTDAGAGDAMAGQKIVADSCRYCGRTRHAAPVCWMTCLFQGMVNLQVNLVQ